MSSITNTHHTALTLPDGTTLPPGIASNVPNWDELKGNAVLKAWEKAGILKVGKETSTEEEKSALQARLDELKVQYDKRAGVPKLRELVAEAEKAKAAGEEGDGAGQGDGNKDAE